MIIFLKEGLRVPLMLWFCFFFLTITELTIVQKLKRERQSFCVMVYVRTGNDQLSIPTSLCTAHVFEVQLMQSPSSYSSPIIAIARFASTYKYQGTKDTSYFIVLVPLWPAGEVSFHNNWFFFLSSLVHYYLPLSTNNRQLTIALE